MCNLTHLQGGDTKAKFLYKFMYDPKQDPEPSNELDPDPKKTFRIHNTGIWKGVLESVFCFIGAREFFYFLN